MYRSLEIPSKISHLEVREDELDLGAEHLGMRVDLGDHGIVIDHL